MTPADVQAISEAIRRGQESRLSDIFVQCPGEIVTFDPLTERGDVRPLIRRPVPMSDESITHEELPIAPSVPIMFPSGGGVRITWDILPGDVVTLHASSYAMGQWLTTGKLSDAGDIRQHHLGSCWAVPECHAERVKPGIGFLRLGGGPLVATFSAVKGERLAGLLAAMLAGSTAGPTLVLSPVNDPLTGLPWNPLDILSSIVKVG